MTLSSTTNRTSTAGDGTVTAFSFPYLFFANDDLKIILVVDSTGVETTQTITTHYTVTGAGVSAGGTVTMVTPPASGETLVVIREEQFTQGLDLVENDPFPSDLVEQQFDTLTMLAQQLNTEIGRSAKLSDGDSTGADVTIPNTSGNGSKFLALAADGLSFVWSALTTTVAVLSDASAQALGTAAAGTSADISRADHVHKLPTGADLSLEIGVDVLAEGDTPIGQHTIFVPAGAMEAAVTTAAATSNAVEIGTSLFAARTMDFATDADDFAYFGIQMPKSWDAGALVLQYIWSATGTTANTVMWSAAAVCLADDEVLTTAFPAATPLGAADTNSVTADDIMVSAEISITVANTPIAEGYVMFEISRTVASDTLAEDARLHGIRIHYTVNTGSDT